MALGLFELVVFVLGAAFLAGLAGSVLGVGGGIFLVPYLTLMPALRLPVQGEGRPRPSEGPQRKAGLPAPRQYPASPLRRLDRD